MKKILPLTLAAIAAAFGVIVLLNYFVFSDPIGSSVADALEAAMVVPVLIWFMAPYSKKYAFTPRQAHIAGGICLGLLMAALFLVDYMWLELSIRRTLLNVFVPPVVMFLVMWMLERFGLFSTFLKDKK